MKFVYLNNDVVHEIIDEFDPKFPNVPIQNRYSEDFLKKCVVLEDSKVPAIGHVKKDKNKFEKPAEIVGKVITPQERKKQLQKEIDEIDRLADIEVKGV